MTEFCECPWTGLVFDVTDRLQQARVELEWLAVSCA